MSKYSSTRPSRNIKAPRSALAATLDGVVDGTNAVFEAKFMLPWAFSEEAAAAMHMAQLQHNMWVIQWRSAALSIITGGGKWVELTIQADPLYQHLLLTAERKFWRCVENGETPYLFGIETPKLMPEDAKEAAGHGVRPSARNPDRSAYRLDEEIGQADP